MLGTNTCNIDSKIVELFKDIKKYIKIHKGYLKKRSREDNSRG